ncbi:MAG: FecR domain-containing protein, partial [Gemmatimonadaceae bacterium]
MNENIDWDRLARYVSGEATAAEAEEVDRWAASDEGRQRLLASVERRWQAAATPSAFDVDRAWQRMAPKLGSGRGSGSSKILPFATRRPAAPRWVYLVAATMILSVALPTFWLARGRSATTSLGAAAPLQVQTAVGERRTIELPDGSQAVLGVRTSLRMEPVLATGPRVVHLDGEAFFTVRHDAERPFRVVASNVVTEDVGTEFSVRAYADERNVRVAVREGAVSVSRAGAESGGNAVLLGDHDVARIAADGVPAVTTDSAVERLFAWRDGDLVFENAPLADVASELSRWYDVDVRFADPELASRHLTSTFKNEPIDEVLRVIGLSAEVRFERRGRLVTVFAAPRTSNGDPVGPRGS